MYHLRRGSSVWLSLIKEPGMGKDDAGSNCPGHTLRAGNVSAKDFHDFILSAL